MTDSKVKFFVVALKSVKDGRATIARRGDVGAVIDLRAGHFPTVRWGGIVSDAIEGEDFVRMPDEFLAR